MMQFYYVKRDLWGVPKGSVERFAPQKAAPLLVEGAIEIFDARKHGDAPGADAVPPDQRRTGGKCPTCGK
jgi:hypothetical protein